MVEKSVLGKTHGDNEIEYLTYIGIFEIANLSKDEKLLNEYLPDAERLMTDDSFKGFYHTKLLGIIDSYRQKGFHIDEGYDRASA